MIGGVIPAGPANQFAQATNHIQSSAYMGGRLTPQAMQQGWFIGEGVLLNYQVVAKEGFCHILETKPFTDNLSAQVYIVKRGPSRGLFYLRFVKKVGTLPSFLRFFFIHIECFLLQVFPK